MRLPGIKVVLLLGVTVGAHAGEGRPEVPPDLVLERFSVAKGGDPLTVPVKVGGKDHLFVVDTGFSVTTFDTSLPLGEPIGTVSVQGIQGKVDLKMYRPPEAFVGRLPLHPLDDINGFDVKTFRQASGLPLEGFLGMDFLGRHVVRVDFDKGELLFLKATPRDAGSAVPILWDPGQVPPPAVMAELVPGQTIRFRIDTGASTTSGACGYLAIQDVRSLGGRGELTEVDSVFSVTLSGTSSSRQYHGKRLRLGEFEVKSPVFTEALGPGRLGLGFWSRFVVTFDFPQRKAYLRKGDRFDSLDREHWNAGGLRLGAVGPAVVVREVDPDSPAARAGLKVGDVIVQIGDQKADKVTRLDLGEPLYGTGRVTCVVRRGAQEHWTTLDLTR
jgi:PDZ domain